jgi:hypothetical protein
LKISPKIEDILKNQVSQFFFIPFDEQIQEKVNLPYLEMGWSIHVHRNVSRFSDPNRWGFLEIFLEIVYSSH